jgi:serine/threonine protein kinase
MKCRDEPLRNKNDISKLMTSANAAKELNEFALIDAADKRKQFYLGKPNKCKPDRILSNIRSISKCPSGKFDPAKIDDYSLLVMKYGGQDIEQFGEEVRTWSKNKEHVDAIELFWLEAVRLFYGLKVLHDNNVVHHDLKPQNIVYDKATNRANFIDFGFMEKKSTRIYAAKMSASWLGNKHHWSFPLEAVCWNKDDYMEAARSGKSENAYKAFADSVAKNCGYFFISTLPVRFMKLHRDNAFKMITTDAFKNVLEFEATDEAYDQFIDKSIDTVDSFGLGIALMFVLHRSRHLLADDFYKKLGYLFGMDMLHPRLFIRSTPEQLLAKYEDILTSSGLLEKHNKHIENHLIADKVSEEMKVAAEIADSTAPALVIDPADGLMHDTEIVRDCPVGKEFNPLTKRCVTACKPGQVRNPEFKCVNPTDAGCPDGFELNPRTRRCVKACKAGHVRNANFNCVSGRGTRKTKTAISPIVAASHAASLVPSSGSTLLDFPSMTRSMTPFKTRSKPRSIQLVKPLSIPSDNVPSLYFPESKSQSKSKSKSKSKSQSIQSDNVPSLYFPESKSKSQSIQWDNIPSDNWSKSLSKQSRKTRSRQSGKIPSRQSAKRDIYNVFSRDL